MSRVSTPNSKTPKSRVSSPSRLSNSRSTSPIRIAPGTPGKPKSNSILGPLQDSHSATLTVIKHSTINPIEVKQVTAENMHDPGFFYRVHDPPIIDDDLPSETAHILMTDIGLDAKNYRNRRILIMSAPSRRCIETATVIAQNFGIDVFYIHYGLTQNMMATLQDNWAYLTEPLYMTPTEMNEIVFNKSMIGVRKKGFRPVRIAGTIGLPLTPHEVHESELEFNERVDRGLREVRGSLEGPGDHALIVAHEDTLGRLAEETEGSIVTKAADCGFLTVCTPSTHSLWITARSRIQMTMRK